MPDFGQFRPAARLRSAVTWRGLPGTNTKPANAAGRAARRSAPRFRSAQFGAPENELSRRLRRFARAHQRRTDEEGIDAAVKADRRRRDSTMPDSETSRRSGARPRQPLGGREVDREIAQVAVVDADQRRAERQRAAHLGFVMNLDQRIHAEAPRFVDHRARCVVVEQRQHHQHGVGAGDPGLDDLPQIDEEILGKDRSVELGAGRRRDRRAIRRSKRVDEHAQRIGDAGIAARKRRRDRRRRGLRPRKAKPS